MIIDFDIPERAELRYAKISVENGMFINDHI